MGLIHSSFQWRLTALHFLPESETLIRGNPIQARLVVAEPTQPIIAGSIDRHPRFCAQYTQLIARRIREQNVFSVVLPCTVSLDEVKCYAPVGIVLSGAPWSVYDKDAPPADARVFELGLPVLGICYGLQFMVHNARRQGASGRQA